MAGAAYLYRAALREEIEREGVAIRSGRLIAAEGWCYTVGLTAIPHPELATYAVEQSRAEHLLRDLADVVRDGHVFKHGDVVDGLIHGYPLAFLRIAPREWTHVDDLFPRSDRDGLQVVSPSKSSHWPWEPGSPVQDWFYWPRPLPTEWNEYSL